MKTREHKISANGLTHYVRDSGVDTAPAAVLLHGFPDSSALWNKLTPALVAAGYRIIAPDLRGFGQTDMAARKADYEINAGSIPDTLTILQKLNIGRAHVAGHDFGAPVAWGLAARYPEIFSTLTAVSVGHTRAYLKAGPEQMRRSWYILFHQFRGVCEAAYRFNDWQFLRAHWTGHGEVEKIVTDLSRQGRLTAGLDWYRANISLARMIRPPAFGSQGEEIVRIPSLGIWSDGEKYLSEAQMTGSAEFVDAPWRYQRIEGASHWIPHDAPGELATALIGHWGKYPI